MNVFDICIFDALDKCTLWNTAFTLCGKCRSSNISLNIEINIIELRAAESIPDWLSQCIYLSLTGAKTKAYSESFHGVDHHAMTQMHNILVSLLCG